MCWKLRKSPSEACSCGRCYEYLPCERELMRAKEACPDNQRWRACMDVVLVLQLHPVYMLCSYKDQCTEMNLPIHPDTSDQRPIRET